MRLFYTPTADGDRSGRVGRIAGRRRVGVALRVGLQRALPVQASAADELAHPDRGGPEDRDVAELRARDGQVVAPRRFRLDALRDELGRPRFGWRERAAGDGGGGAGARGWWGAPGWGGA